MVMDVLQAGIEFGVKCVHGHCTATVLMLPFFGLWSAGPRTTG